jgi:hypothetical protein
MPSEYDPLFPDRRTQDRDFEPIRELFAEASRPYLRTPWSWLAWALILPVAAFATPYALARFGPAGILFAWSGSILAGGAVELTGIWKAGKGLGSSPLASWAFRAQGNLSLVALVLSVLMIWLDLPWALPGIWLLLLGHSFYILGGLSFEPFRLYGLTYQAGGVAALALGRYALAIFALATFCGNLWMAWSVWRHRTD